MSKHIIARLILLVPTLFGVSFLVFIGMYLMPGDPVMTMLSATNTVASPETMASIRQQLGIDDPWHVRYLHFLSDAVRGDLGESWRTREDVLTMVASQFPSTLQLAVVGLGVAFLVGTTLGTLAAVFRGRWIDTVAMVVAMAGVSMPSFWLGLLLLYLFSVRLGWVTITGSDDLKHLVLPASVLGLNASAIVSRLTRSSMLDVLRSEYVTTARAKGLRERAVVLAHALPNALIPTVTVVGLQFGALLGGSMIIEIVFARQGVGQIAVTAIQGKDFPVVQGVVLLVATSYVLVNLAVDILYAFLDPRIRHG
ncbi:MAG: peptide/nickel transport system permease protein [Thermomicrobiales bacterium]|nr:peptide/nickel transport system permease protein [Thermomicrobiales bacterium]